MTDHGDWQSRVAESARRYRELRERLTQQSISAASQGGAVRVTVSASGLLADLVLAESTRSVSAADLAAQVMDCVRRAQARIPELLRQAVTESVGTADPNAELLIAEARQRFPAPPEPPESGQPAWQPDEMRFSIPETSARSTPKPARAPRPRRIPEEIWDDVRPILKDV